MGNAVAVTGNNFDEEVLKSKEPVLVDFWAVWCGPCRQVAPAVEEIATEYKGRVKVVKVDVDEAQDVSIKYGIQSIPTLMVFKGGNPVERLVGAYPKPAILAKLQRHIESGNGSAAS
jgi:thioredoxin 1